MKLTIGEYEVEIKVKAKGRQRANAEDAGYFLNDLSVLLLDARTHNRRIGADSFADMADEYGSDIYEYLKAKGVYDRI